MNKKGISPLIATVLIIGFTIVIALIIVMWAQGLYQKHVERGKTEQLLSELKCMSDVKFKVTERSCVNNTLLSVNIQNIGIAPIIKIYTKKEGVGEPIDTGDISLAPLYEQQYNFSISCGSDVEFTVYPVMLTDLGEEAVCKGSAKSFVVS